MGAISPIPFQVTEFVHIDWVRKMKKYISLPTYISVITSSEIKELFLATLSKISTNWVDISVRKHEQEGSKDVFTLMVPLSRDSPKQGYKIKDQFVAIYVGFFPKEPIYKGNTPLNSDIWFNAYLVIDDGNINNLPEWISYIKSVQEEHLERNSVYGVPPFLNYVIGRSPSNDQKEISSLNSVEVEGILKDIHLSVLNA